MKDEVAVIACSHRGGGNSDAAAALLARGVREAGGSARVIALRQFEVQPCLACRSCAAHPQSACVLANEDQAEELYEALLTAPAVAFASPIYFYGPPSRLKTWIDRGQRFWEARRKADAWITSLPQRPAFACLVAGQPAGDRLFDGVRLSLKYFLVNFGLTLTEPLGLRGLDAAGDLLADGEGQRRVLALGAEIARAVAEHRRGTSGA